MAGLLLAAQWDELNRLVDEHNRNGSPSAGSCPEKVARNARGARPVNLVAAYRTSRHDVFICRTASGQYHYHGEITGDPSSAMDLPAQKTARGYVAHNKTYTYEVRDRRIIVTHRGRVVGDYAWRAFAPT